MTARISAASIRHFGLSMACWAIALAAFFEYWFVSFLAGVLVFGIGVGLWDWKGGDEHGVR